MISVTIIGSGNVAYHLANAFLKSDAIQIQQLYTRNLKDLEFWKNKIQTTNTLESIENSDITIIAISDDSIQEVSKQIQNSFVVHTSGAKGIQELKNYNRKGVLYPLQSFSKEKEVDFRNVPFCLEAENVDDLNLLKELTNSLKSKSYEVNSEQRKYLHIAAVFVNNFSNHMYTVAQEICKTNQVPFEVLQPLIQETTHKISSLSALHAQTGPAKRKDQETINNHMQLLNKHQQELYQKITESIQYYGEKL